MQLSKKTKLFCGLFIAFLESIFCAFSKQKKGRVGGEGGVGFSEIIDSERRGY